MRHLNIKFAFNGIIGVFLLLVIGMACLFASVSLAKTVTTREPSKQTLNLCSAEAIQIGEDIEYVYVKVKK